MTTPPPTDVPSPSANAYPATPTAQAYPAPPAADAYAPAPPAKRSKLPIILGAVAVAVLLIAIAIGGTLWFVGREDLSREQAQRECRTALEREAEQRADLVGSGSKDVLISVTGVEIQDVWETDNGWSVNGTANITMTTPMLGQTPTSVALTCEATSKDGQVRTTVKNRL